MKACPSPQRVDDILRLLLLFREGRLLRYVEFLRLLGTAAATVVPLGLLSLRPLQRFYRVNVATPHPLAVVLLPDSAVPSQ
ncbi:unnamed protein product [Boreogadus saida]